MIVSLLAMCIYAQGGKEIKIEYQHSMRIPYNKIDIQIHENQNEHQIIVTTAQMIDQVGYEYSNTENTFCIDKEYFDNMYDELLALNFSEIIKNNESVIGSDGFVVKLTIGNSQNNIVLTIWSPDYDSEKRKLVQLDNILKEIFLKTNLAEYYL